MSLGKGFNFLVSNWLFIALLGAFFFFGDYIYNWVKNSVKGKTNYKFVDFILALILILIISSLPLIISQIITDTFSIGLSIFIVIVLFGLCFWKYCEN